MLILFFMLFFGHFNLPINKLEINMNKKKFIVPICQFEITTVLHCTLITWIRALLLAWNTQKFNPSKQKWLHSKHISINFTNNCINFGKTSLRWPKLLLKWTNTIIMHLFFTESHTVPLHQQDNHIHASNN